MKTEPDVFSYDDLEKAPKRTAPWEGVRNYQARNLMRDEFQVGDGVFIYHSSCDEPGVYGIAEVVKPAYPDPTALNPKSAYFDEAFKKLGESRWVMVDVRAVERLKKPVLLSEIKAHPKLQTMTVVKKGSRLSIQSVAAKEWDVIVRLGVASR